MKVSCYQSLTLLYNLFYCEINHLRSISNVTCFVLCPDRDRACSMFERLLQFNSCQSSFRQNFDSFNYTILFKFSKDSSVRFSNQEYKIITTCIHQVFWVVHYCQSGLDILVTQSPKCLRQRGLQNQLSFLYTVAKF